MGYTKSKGKKAEENGKAKESKIVKAIIKCIETKGVLPWHNELIVSQIKGSAMPVTLGANKKPYRGVNAFLTAMYMVVEGYDSNQFMTFNAIKKAGGSVNKGATGCPIVLPIFRYYDKDKNLYSEQQFKEMTEEEKEETIQKRKKRNYQPKTDWSLDIAPGSECVLDTQTQQQRRNKHEI